MSLRSHLQDFPAGPCTSDIPTAANQVLRTFPASPSVALRLLCLTPSRSSINTGRATEQLSPVITPPGAQGLLPLPVPQLCQAWRLTRGSSLGPSGPHTSLILGPIGAQAHSGHSISAPPQDAAQVPKLFSP